MPGEPASSGSPEPEPSPLTSSDLAAGLRRLSGIARFLGRTGPPAGTSMDAPRPGEPDSGARRVVACDARGIEITASGPGFTRHGLVTWPQAASWIDAGVTPARLGIIILADRLSAFCRSHRDQLTAAGTCDPGTAITELDQIRGHHHRDGHRRGPARPRSRRACPGGPPW